MFTYHEDEQTTKMAIERATIADLDFNLAKGSASGSTAKKGKDGKKLLGKEEAVSASCGEIRGMGVLMGANRRTCAGWGRLCLMICVSGSVWVGVGMFG